MMIDDDDNDSDNENEDDDFVKDYLTDEKFGRIITHMILR